MPVHFLVDQTEDYGLVAYKRLVVAFAVADGLFVGAAVCEFPEYGCRMPVFILLLLDHFDPVVGYSHREPVIEAHAAVFEFRGYARHAAHFLRYRYGFRVDFMYQYVGEGQIDEGVGVFIAVVIISITAECLAEPVVVIEHRCHSVETKSVEFILFEPELAV